MANSVHRSPYTVQIPVIDIPSYVFSSATPAAREAPQFFDADHPLRNFSLAEAEIFVKRFAKGLRRYGLQHGDRILLCSSNHLYYNVALWGVMAAGGIFTGASPSATVGELSYQLQDSGASILLANWDKVDVAIQAAKEAGFDARNVYLFCDPTLPVPNCRVKSWVDLWVSELDIRGWTWRTFASEQESKTTTAVINYSSGTTGLPKGVELSHWNLVANTEQVIFKRALMANTAAGRSRKERLSRSGERWLAVLPMYHAFGQAYFCLTAPRIGAKVYITSKFSMDGYMLYLDIYRITFMNAVPTIYNKMARLTNPAKYNLKAVENVTNGSAPLEPAIGQQVAAKFLPADTKVKQGWGMTETTCSVTGFAMDDEDDGRSIGWLHPNCSAKICPVPGRKVESVPGAKGAVGEIWVAGPNIMKGYWKKPRQTEDTFAYEDGERWLKTGDIGYVDQRGCIYIVDRLKELIKVKGLQVSPAELEAALCTRPGVQEAAIVGVKHGTNEYVRAFVVRTNAAITEAHVFDYIKERFAQHKWLSGGVYFIDQIPRTRSGKVVKRLLPQPELRLKSRL